MIVSEFQRIEGRDFKHWGAVEGGLGFGNLWKAMWGLEFMHWLVTWEYWASYGCKSNQGHRAHGGGSSPQQSVGVWLSGWKVWRKEAPDLSMDGAHALHVSGNLTPEAWRTLPACSFNS